MAHKIRPPGAITPAELSYLLAKRLGIYPVFEGYDNQPKGGTGPYPHFEVRRVRATERSSAWFYVNLWTGFGAGGGNWDPARDDGKALDIAGSLCRRGFDFTLRAGPGNICAEFTLRSQPKFMVTGYSSLSPAEAICHAVYWATVSPAMKAQLKKTASPKKGV